MRRGEAKWLRKHLPPGGEGPIETPVREALHQRWPGYGQLVNDVWLRVRDDLWRTWLPVNFPQYDSETLLRLALRYALKGAEDRMARLVEEARPAEMAEVASAVADLRGEVAGLAAALRERHGLGA
jgi:hypothetical protein